MYKVDIFNNVTRITNITKDELNLDKTLDCGQAFRWKKISTGEWQGVIDNNIVIIGQKVFSDGKEGLYTNLDIEYIDKLIYYFNLDLNYTDVISRISLTEFEKLAYSKGKGIHILRQGLLESIVTFMMSSANTMHNIRLIITKLCERYGNKLEIEWNGKTYIDYSFPTLEQLSKITYTEARAMSMGMRADYFISFIEYLDKNPEYLKELQSCSHADAIKKLTKLRGVGIKVANCISLFSLHNVDAFPIDTHINQIINTHYNGYIDLTRYNGYAGIIQQYIFYYKAFN